MQYNFNDPKLIEQNVICKMCHFNPVCKSPLIITPIYEYKKSNYLCDECKTNYKMRKIKCKRYKCSMMATEMWLDTNDAGYYELQYYCCRCV